MRVFIITVDEYYFIPRFLEGVINNNDINIVGIGAMTPTLSNESSYNFAVKLFNTFGPKIFAQHCIFYGKYFFLDLRNSLLRRGKFKKFIDNKMSIDKCYSVKSLATNNNIDFYEIKDVNSPDFISKLRKMEIDVIVSVGATQLFKKDILNLPKICCTNIHSSLLPEYRGVSPSFWTMLNCEKKTGVTVHYMNEKIDSGNMILQKVINIESDDTLKTLNEKVAEVGANTLNDALFLIKNDIVESSPIDITKGTYFSLPDRNDVRRFIDCGKKFY